MFSVECSMFAFSPRRPFTAFSRGERVYGIAAAQKSSKYALNWLAVYST